MSVVIPHLDRVALLRDAVASVLDSSCGNVEAIVVDDGSSDEQLAGVLALAGPGVIIIRREGAPAGPSRCRNIGVASSRSEYVVFLDSDDFLSPWCIETRLSAAVAQPGFDFWVFRVAHFHNTPGDGETLWAELDSPLDDSLRFASGQSVWQTSSPLWKRSSFLAVGGFNERVFYGDDSDLHLRALISGLRHCKFPRHLPDVFVRRSEAPRITNSLDSRVLSSRLARLREGARFLGSVDVEQSVRDLWAGQYLTEIEFLLFNVQSPNTCIAAVLAAWEEDTSPSSSLARAVRAYVWFAVATRNRAYLSLRIARRMAMRILPSEYFPDPRAGVSPSLEPHERDEIRLRLSRRASNGEARLTAGKSAPDTHI